MGVKGQTGFQGRVDEMGSFADKRREESFAGQTRRGKPGRKGAQARIETQGIQGGHVPGGGQRGSALAGKGGAL